MKVFKFYFKIEFKRLFHIISIIVLISFFALAMNFVLNGIHRHEKVLDKKEKFKKLEQSKVSRQISYAKRKKMNKKTKINENKLATEVTEVTDLNENTGNSTAKNFKENSNES
jgi:hypothetical protein